MDPDRYATEQALTLRDDWQFSRIFAPEQARPGFTALLALRAELQHVIGQATEAGIAAMKFEWWRGEIQRGFDGKAQHPLARALGAHLGKAGSAPEYCIELVDAAETESEAFGTFTTQDFQLYLYRSGGVLAEQLAQLCGAIERDALNAARRLGQLKRHVDLVLTTGAMLRAGHWFFPAEWLEPVASNPQTVLAEPESKNVRALLGNMLAALDRDRIETRTAMENIALPPALQLQWSLAQRDYRKMRDRPAIALATRPAKGSGLVRLWQAWRGARAAAARHA